MATNERLPLIKHQRKLSGDQEQSQTKTREDCHELNRNNTHRSPESENTLFRLRNQSIIQTCCGNVRSKLKKNHCCLWSSKAVILVLLWNLIICIGFQSFFNPSLYTGTLIIDVGAVHGDYSLATLVHGLTYGFSALLFVFYPLAGFLADVYWGRYTTIKNSLCFLFWSMVIIVFLAGLALLGSTPMILQATPWPSNTTETITSTMICIIFGIPVFLGIMFCLCSLVAFSSNVIQFGIDQLHDAPAESSTVYIHWYVWSSQVGPFILRLLVDIGVDLQSVQFIYIIIALVIGLAVAFLPVTLCWERCLHRWFLIDQGNANPYKLVYKVIKFAKDHTNPIRRSAFTYCEDELPSRLDLGKEKYGGPFTTEEVENVKAFTGILRVLLSLGPMFFAEFAFSDMILSLEQAYALSKVEYYATSLITPMVILVLIPLYLCLLKPFIHAYIPGMLKRMGLGMMLLLLSGLCTLIMGIVGNSCTEDNYYYCGLSTYLFGINTKFLMIQFILNAVSYLLFYVSAFEFICAQSPHSMKGLFIGTFFAIKGVFKLLGVLLLYIPVGYKCNPLDLIVKINKSMPSFPICGFIYYFINVIIALIGIFAFAIVARRYEYRERDEPDNIYRYAEEYYANAQDEPNYDYDDYDNLNVETIQN